MSKEIYYARSCGYGKARDLDGYVELRLFRSVEDLLDDCKDEGDDPESMDFIRLVVEDGKYIPPSTPATIIFPGER